MTRSRLVAIALSVAIATAPAPSQAGIFVPPPILGSPTSPALGVIGCVTGIMLAAIDASRRFNRELTPAEAASCGLLYWINLANLRP